MEGNGGQKPPFSGLAGWKAGQMKMTTASAGEVVSKAAAKAKPKATVKKPRQPTNNKPYAEKTKEEKFGTTPPKHPVHKGKQVKDVLQYLESHQERAECISWDEIVEHAIPAWYDTEEGGELYNLLTHNPCVVASAHGFMYRSQHGITDKASLLRFLRSHPEGVRASDIKDGYEHVLRDADQLHSEGLAFKFYNAEFKVDVYFAAPESRATAPDDLVDVFLKTQLPSDPAELVSSIKHLGMRSALDSAKSQRKPISLMKTEKQRKKRKMNVRHLTNVHMAGLLTGAEAQRFDRIDRN